MHREPDPFRKVKEEELTEDKIEQVIELIPKAKSELQIRKEEELSGEFSFFNELSDHLPVKLSEEGRVDIGKSLEDWGKYIEFSEFTPEDKKQEFFDIICKRQQYDETKRAMGHWRHLLNKEIPETIANKEQDLKKEIPNLSEEERDNRAKKIKEEIKALEEERQELPIKLQEGAEIIKAPEKYFRGKADSATNEILKQLIGSFVLFKPCQELHAVMEQAKTCLTKQELEKFQKLQNRFEEMSAKAEDFERYKKEKIIENASIVLGLSMEKTEKMGPEILREFILLEPILKRDKAIKNLKTWYGEELLKIERSSLKRKEKREQIGQLTEIQKQNKRKIMDLYFEESIQCANKVAKEALVATVRPYLKSAEQQILAESEGMQALVEITESENITPYFLSHDFKVRGETSEEIREEELEEGLVNFPRDTKTYEELKGKNSIVNLNGKELSEEELKQRKAEIEARRHFLATNIEFGYSVGGEWRRKGPIESIEYSTEDIRDEKGKIKEKKRKIEKIYFHTPEEEKHFFLQVEGRELTERDEIRHKELRNEVFSYLRGEVKEGEKPDSAQEELKEMLRIFFKFREYHNQDDLGKMMEPPLSGEEFLEEFIKEYPYAYYSEAILKKYGLTLEKVILGKALESYSQEIGVEITEGDKKELLKDFIKNNDIQRLPENFSENQKKEIIKILQQTRQDLVDVGLLVYNLSPKGEPTWGLADPKDVVYIGNIEERLDKEGNPERDEDGTVKRDIIGTRRRHIPAELEYLEQGEKKIQETNGDFEEGRKYTSDPLQREFKKKRNLYYTMHNAYLFKPRKWSEKEWQENWPGEEYNPRELRSALYNRRFKLTEGEIKCYLMQMLELRSPKMKKILGEVSHWVAIQGITQAESGHFKLIKKAKPKEADVFFDADEPYKAEERAYRLTDAQITSVRIAQSLSREGVESRILLWPEDFEQGLYGSFDVEDLMLKKKGKREERGIKKGMKIYTEICQNRLTPDEFIAGINKRAQEQGLPEKFQKPVEELVSLKSRLFHGQEKYRVAAQRGAEGIGDEKTKERFEHILENSFSLIDFLQQEATEYYLGVKDLSKPFGLRNIYAGRIPQETEKTFNVGGIEHSIKTAEHDILVNEYFPPHTPPEIGTERIFSPAEPNNFLMKASSRELQDILNRAGELPAAEKEFLIKDSEFLKGLNREEKHILGKIAREQSLRVKDVLDDISHKGFERVIKEDSRYQELSQEAQETFEKKIKEFVHKRDIVKGYKAVYETKLKPTNEAIAKLSLKEAAGLHIVGNDLLRRFPGTEIVFNNELYRYHKEGAVAEEAKIPISIFSKKQKSKEGGPLIAAVYYTLDDAKNPCLPEVPQLIEDLELAREKTKALKEAKEVSQEEKNEAQAELARAQNELFDEAKGFIRERQKTHFETSQLSFSLREPSEKQREGERQAIKTFFELAKEYSNMPDHQAKLKTILLGLLRGVPREILSGQLVPEREIIYLEQEDCRQLLNLADEKTRKKWGGLLSDVARAGIFNISETGRGFSEKSTGSMVLAPVKTDERTYVSLRAMPTREQALKNPAFRLDRKRVLKMSKEGDEYPGAFLPLRGISPESERARHDYFFCHDNLARLKTKELNEGETKKLIICFDEIQTLKEEGKILEKIQSGVERQKLPEEVIGLDNSLEQLYGKNNQEKLVKDTGVQEIILSIEDLSKAESSLDGLDETEGILKEIYFISQQIKKLNKDVSLKVKIGAAEEQTIEEYLAEEKGYVFNEKTEKALKSNEEFLELSQKFISYLSLPLEPLFNTRKDLLNLDPAELKNLREKKTITTWQQKRIVELQTEANNLEKLYRTLRGKDENIASYFAKRFEAEIAASLNKESFYQRAEELKGGLKELPDFLQKIVKEFPAEREEWQLPDLTKFNLKELMYLKLFAKNNSLFAPLLETRPGIVEVPKKQTVPSRKQR